jgi:hypothetical protein
MQKIKILALLFCLTCILGCDDTSPEPDVTKWKNFYTSIQSHTLEFDFPPHKSEKYAKKLNALPSTVVFDMDWLDSSEKGKDLISGNFEFDGDITTFNIRMGLGEYYKVHAVIPSLETLKNEIIEHKRQNRFLGIETYKIIKVNDRKWLHEIQKWENTNIVSHDSYFLPLTNKYFLVLVGSFCGKQDYTENSSGFKERQKILRDILNTIKIKKIK